MKAIISGVEYPIRTNTLNIEDQIESRSSANFAVNDLQDEYNFQKGQQVRIEHDGNLLFAGFIEISEKVALSNVGNYIHEITCIDNHYLADKRIVVMAETNTTAGAMVEQIVERYLESEGIVNTNKYWDDYADETWQQVIEE